VCVFVHAAVFLELVMQSFPTSSITSHENETEDEIDCDASQEVRNLHRRHGTLRHYLRVMEGQVNEPSISDACDHHHCHHLLHYSLRHYRLPHPLLPHLHSHFHRVPLLLHFHPRSWSPLHASLMMVSLVTPAPQPQQVSSSLLPALYIELSVQ